MQLAGSRTRAPWQRSAMDSISSALHPPPPLPPNAMSGLSTTLACYFYARGGKFAIKINHRTTLRMPRRAYYV